MCFAYTHTDVHAYGNNRNFNGVIGRKLLYYVAVFARSTCQTEQHVTSSYILIWKREFIQHVKKKVFMVIDRYHITRPYDTYKNKKGESFYD